MSNLMPPTPERLRHGSIVSVEVIPEGTLAWGDHSAGDIAWRDRKASMLDRYWHDQLLCSDGDLDRAARRHDAGTRLAELYDATGLRRRQMGIYGPRSRAHAEMTDDQASAFAAFQGLVLRLQALSPSVASAVVNLCIYDFDPVDRRDLIRGLDLLVRHWGL